MKPTVASLFLVTILSGHVMLTSATSWWQFANCLKDNMGWSALGNPEVICAASQMAASYSQMSWYSCRNCDKYFHCKGNYNAVRRCGGSSDTRRAAEVIR